MAAKESDKELIIRMQSGEPAAFAALYEKYVGLVQYVGKRFGATSERCDDLVQEVFLKLYNSSSQIRNTEQLGPWLITAAKNWLIDESRRVVNKCSRMQSLSGEDEPADLMPSRADDPEAQLTRNFVGAVVRGLLLEMAADTGIEDFRAFYVDGLTIDEIAGRNAEPTGTITSRLTRLRKRFRVLYEQRYGRKIHGG